MSRGKHLSLEEARKDGLLDQFAKENPNEVDAERFETLVYAMATQKPKTVYPPKQKDDGRNGDDA